MKRDIFLSLEQWKTSTRRKPLILNGARQVGKTYALKYFGKTSYENTIYLNFERNEQLAHFFEKTIDPIQIIQFLSIYAEEEIHPESTLIIFDEIQECPKALNSLKYFCEDANEYHVVAAGSLLGVKTANEKGFAVGKVNFLHLYPMSFFEFLSAIKHEKLRTFLEQISNFDPIPNTFHEMLIQTLKFYLFVGGMPEAVSEYAQSKNLSIVREIQHEILNAYEKDFGKHAPPQEMMKITAIWNQIHRQLSKENRKFIFSAIRQSARGRDYEYSIQWLIDAGLIHKNCMVETPKIPLSAYAETHTFKIFLLDVGLLGAQSGLSAHSIIEGDSLFTEFKGALIENFVAQELIASRQQPLYYWTSSGTAEIDFLVEQDHEIYPLEVKSGNSSKKKSLLVYEEKYHPKKLIRTTPMNLKHDGDIYNYPLYLISKLLKY